MKIKYIDPPEGWRYGFPKVLPSDWADTAPSLYEWLLNNDYPKEKLDVVSLRYCRMWEEETEETNAQES